MVTVMMMMMMMMIQVQTDFVKPIDNVVTILHFNSLIITIIIIINSTVCLNDLRHTILVLLTNQEEPLGLVHHASLATTCMYLRLINSCALAGGPSPNIFFPIHEYHPASNSVTAAFVSVVVEHPAQLSPGMLTPLNCHLCSVVTGLPIVLQQNVAVAPSARVRFLG